VLNGKPRKLHNTKQQVLMYADG